MGLGPHLPLGADERSREHGPLAGAGVVPREVAEAEADRAQLLELQGEDANKSEALVELIRKR